jgi:hypothetical protein
MTIQQLYDYVAFSTNKSQTGNSFKWKDFIAMLQPVGDMLLDQILGVRLDSQNPLVPMVFEANRHNTTMLEKHLKHMGSDFGTPGLFVDNIGVAALPSDCLYPSSFKIDALEEVVGAGGECDGASNGTASDLATGSFEILTDMAFSSREDNPNRKGYPYCNIVGRKVRFRPKNVQLVAFTYIRKHQAPQVVTEIVNDVEVVVSAGEIDFPERMHRKYGDAMISYWNHYHRDMESNQFTEQRIMKG